MSPPRRTPSCRRISCSRWSATPRASPRRSSLGSARRPGSGASLAFTGTAATFDPKMAVNWPAASTPALQTEDVVAPNEIGTFTFKVKGVAPGTYRIDVRPTVAAVGTLRDQGVYTEVTVR